MQGKLGLNYVIRRLRPYLELRHSIPTVLFVMMVMTMLFIGEPPYALAEYDNQEGIKTAQRDNGQTVEKKQKPVYRQIIVNLPGSLYSSLYCTSQYLAI